MGAISPGPSLMVVIKNTISGGSFQGVLTAIGHGIGLGIYAFIAIFGLSTLLTTNTQIFLIIQKSGALLLIWLAYNLIVSKTKDKLELNNKSHHKGFLEGFFIAFLNPKILFFFGGVFSQFITPNTTIYERLIIAAMAGIIDTIWYVLVATFLSKNFILKKLKTNSLVIDRIIGFTLLTLALIMIIKS